MTNKIMKERMKKTIVFAAIAALVLVSCNKENNEAPKLLKLTASIEQANTKATLNDLNLSWSAGDQIGVYFSDGGDSGAERNQSYTLEGAGGSSSGTFNRDGGSGTSATFAFFPWQGAGSGYTNIWDNTIYLNLPSSFTYNDSELLTPLVGNFSDAANIQFKYLGGAIKVVIKNLNAHAKSIGMTVVGQKVVGDFSASLASYDPLTPPSVSSEASSDEKDQTIWFNFTPSDSPTDKTFVFPVPCVNTPKLQFIIYDQNNVVVWSKKLKAQTNSIGRADVMVFDDLDLSTNVYDFYSNFSTDISNDWAVCGTMTNNWSVADQLGMNWETGDSACWLVAKNVSLSESDKFKVKAKANWDEAYPPSDFEVKNSSDWAGDGNYNILFNWNTHEVKICAVNTYPVLH